MRDGRDAEGRLYTLGGEQSGHVIFSDYLFTGDGLCTALNAMLRTLVLTDRTLADLASDLTTHPQVLLNVRVRERVDPRDGAGDCRHRMSRYVEACVAGQGRLLVRYSGAWNRCCTWRDDRKAGIRTRSAAGRRRSSTWCEGAPWMQGLGAGGLGT